MKARLGDAATVAGWAGNAVLPVDAHQAANLAPRRSVGGSRGHGQVRGLGRVQPRHQARGGMLSRAVHRPRTRPRPGAGSGCGHRRVVQRCRQWCCREQTPATAVRLREAAVRGAASWAVEARPNRRLARRYVPVRGKPATCPAWGGAWTARVPARRPRRATVGDLCTPAVLQRRRDRRAMQPPRPSCRLLHTKGR